MCVSPPFILWKKSSSSLIRWKERYLILTRDYIQFYKKSSSGVTDMGDFLTKVGRDNLARKFVILIRNM